MSTRCLFVSDEDCNIICYNLAQAHDDQKDGCHQRSRAWAKKAVHKRTGRPQSRLCAGQSTLLHVIYGGTSSAEPTDNEKCDNGSDVTVNILDFLSYPMIHDNNN